GYPKLEAKLFEIKRNLEQYGQQINLGLNWRWIYATPKTSGDRATPWAYFSYSADPPLTAEEIAAYLAGPSPSDTTASPRRGATVTRREQPTATACGVSRTTRTLTQRQAPGPRRWMVISPLPRAESTAA